jgi:hypothetical protein
MTRILTKMATCLVVVVALLGDARPATAAFLNTTDRGWYDFSGTHDPSNNNYIVGVTESILYRNFFVFDLSTVTDPVTSATLRLWNPELNVFPGTATYTLHEVTTSIPTLTAGTGGVAAFNDLGDGPAFGSISVSAADAGTFLLINLNAAGLAALNANLGGSFALGGELIPLSDETYIFGFTGSGNPEDGRTQVLYETANANVVPAPPSAILAAIGVFGLIGGRVLRRRPLAPTAA